MKKYSIPNTRLGGTSFIVHENYVSGVRYTAERCDDVALLLTCVGDEGEWLPKKEEICEIKHIIAGEGTSLHVHLPTDGSCDTHEAISNYEKKILMAIERAEPLNAHTFVLHLDIIGLRSLNILASSDQQENIKQMLQNIARQLNSPEQLAIENLETFPMDFIDFSFENTKYSRCMDIGHIWKESKNPANFIPTWFEKIRLIHLHGLKPKYLFDVYNPQYTNIAPSLSSIRHLYGKKIRDHKGLENMPIAWLDAVLHPLWLREYEGVLNLEVFSVEAFEKSYQAVLESRHRFENQRYS